MNTPSITKRLRDAAEAYPQDLFPPVTDHDRKYCGDAVTRASAGMGRHFAPLFNDAADEIERLLAAVKKHKLYVWGEATSVAHSDDAELYAATIDKHK